MRGMKASLVRLFIFALPLSVFAQQLAHEAGVVNIEVPVRVYQGNRFVDNLTLADFEITEDGVPQTPLAVYLVRKTAIAKREEKTAAFRPQVEKRNFLLLFECNDYVPELSKAIDDFFGRVLTPKDSLMVVTPLESYNFKDEAFARLPKEKIVAQLKSLLKRDIGRASLAYRALLRDIKDGGVSRSLMFQLRKLKTLSLPGFMSAADYLKALEGQKFVFLFYQKETIPIPDFDDLEAFEYGDSRRAQLRHDQAGFFRRLDHDPFRLSHEGDGGHRDGRAPDDGQRPRSRDADLPRFPRSDGDDGRHRRHHVQCRGGDEDGLDASENYYLLYYAPSRYAKDGVVQGPSRSRSERENLTVYPQGRLYRGLG